jgi:hypothetical protein
MALSFALPHFRLSLDQVYDVQYFQPNGGEIRWHKPDRIHTDAGRKTADWYMRRKAENCHLAFYLEARVGGGHHLRFGCFANDGILVEPLYGMCDVQLLGGTTWGSGGHGVLFFVGDGSWGTLILPMCLDGAANCGERNMQQYYEPFTQPIRPAAGFTSDDRILLSSIRAAVQGCTGDPNLLDVREWLRVQRARSR